MSEQVLIFTAGERKTIPGAGHYYRITEGTASVEVRVNNGAVVQRSKGMGGRSREQIATVELYSATAQTVRIEFSYDEIIDDRLAVTEAVEVIDAAVLKSKAIGGFEGGESTPGSVGNYTWLGLDYAVDAGLAAIVKSVTISSGAGGTFQLLGCDATHATFAAWFPTTQCGNKYVGQAIATAKTGSLVNTAYPPTDGSTVAKYRTVSLGAGEAVVIYPEYPWIVTYQNPLCVVSQAQNVAFAIGMEFEEYAL